MYITILSANFSISTKKPYYVYYYIILGLNNKVIWLILFFPINFVEFYVYFLQKYNKEQKTK